MLILFHSGGYKNLKHFYIYYVQKHMKKEFPETVAYNRFVELQKKVVMHLAIFLKTCCLGKCTGISYIDSTPLRSCHIKREKQHKVFKGIAQKVLFFLLRLFFLLFFKGGSVGISLAFSL